jgi:hypothetical protein
MRVVGRAIVPGILLWLSGVPGTPWVGAAPWLWLRIGAFVFALPGVALWLLAIANVIKNRRALLVLMPTGSLERPQSIQEKWLKAPQEYAIGRTVTVLKDPLRFVSAAEPRVTLTADGTVGRIPLWGTTPQDFVTQANERLKGRGVTLEHAETDADQAEKG